MNKKQFKLTITSIKNITSYYYECTELCPMIWTNGILIEHLQTN